MGINHGCSLQACPCRFLQPAKRTTTDIKIFLRPPSPLLYLSPYQFFRRHTISTQGEKIGICTLQHTTVNRLTDNSSATKFVPISSCEQATSSPRIFHRYPPRLRNMPPISVGDDNDHPADWPGDYNFPAKRSRGHDGSAYYDRLPSQRHLRECSQESSKT
ncbi:hypothetical protein P152DRAFT_94022 [Eremomyces bilateralis CBS 781.70]|uniref:Uncharacterized protein n=1 Tax=Eremomyces bilateralis CBS 781.70 TaxID=1392243 RepID=A0A6G1FYD7_9PEZI|nr:uncharacterized protein P152DRAFT_94022 [Eremomyces bilateralis CBS 781.70]KAF1810710.1 hypothetical protein P152DRAFT_94022 [Eremomyces bilateralis CBS 781.70]